MERNEFQHVARLKLAMTVWKEKYEKECRECQSYWKKHIIATQWQSQNLDDHTVYLTSLRQDKSLYPHGNVMLCSKLICKLRESSQKEEDVTQRVIDKGLSSFAPSGVTLDLDIKYQYFIQVLQKSDSSIIDRRDHDFSKDQNIGLHDLVPQPSLHRMDTTQGVTVSGHTAPIKVDAGYCPFCSFFVGCHRTLNTHVRGHLQLSMFCGIGDSFFAAHD